ncbi:IDEAL domain-containing protein [Halalkalibacter krulwichiae]|uniref:IDEAL domain protein n=1 Tax=Halalkalibacter krulwichiae TaxID=199441 RepID=A0A1X9M9U1_9BACI|nr:IDEAL domain-containing protein [Halalkalibacter krulwichiae]ARK30185.1 IDEAL domain protein [Halalkalibacter krulwichiae]
MEINNKKTLRVGDWIKGKSRTGELIHGYIDGIELYNTLIRVLILKSDNKNLVGRYMKLDEREVEVQSPITNFNEGELLNLIDMALSTKDERWFYELASKLNKIKRLSSI